MFPLNPRPTKPFFVAQFKKETRILYHSIARDLYFLYIPKSVPTSQVGRHSDVIVMVNLEIADFQ